LATRVEATVGAFAIVGAESSDEACVGDEAKVRRGRGSGRQTRARPRRRAPTDIASRSRGVE
jgi:hypothetical protein